MKKLNEKILHALKSGKETEKIFRMLLKAQENLLKNHSNPVFNKVDTNKILKAHTSLDDVGKSLYRYNTLQEHHLDSQAQEEKQNIENNVLKTGISNNKYIWHSENGKKTCEVCASLDGKEFDFYDEVPERPHPNCRCYVEVINDKDECDCLTNLLIWQEECQIACFEVENLIQEAKDTKLILEEFIKYLFNYSNDNISEYIKELYVLIKDIVAEIYNMVLQVVKTIQIFYKNWNELRTLSAEIGHYVNYSAEYYHTKANCEAAQLGDVGEKVAIILGYARECGDIVKEVLSKHQTLEQAFQHSVHDLEVNEYGRKLGRENPNIDPIDIINKPENLPKEHW